MNKQSVNKQSATFVIHKSGPKWPAHHHNSVRFLQRHRRTAIRSLAMIAIALLVAWPVLVSACVLDGKPSLFANGHLAIVNQQVPTSATVNVWARFRFTASFRAGVRVVLREDGSAALKSLIPDQSHARWRWYFGDGSTAIGRTVSHAYRKPGTYRLIIDGYAPADKAWFTFDRATISVIK